MTLRLLATTNMASPAHWGTENRREKIPTRAVNRWSRNRVILKNTSASKHCMNSLLCYQKLWSVPLKRWNQHSPVQLGGLKHSWKHTWGSSQASSSNLECLLSFPPPALATLRLPTAEHPAVLLLLVNPRFSPMLASLLFSSAHLGSASSLASQTSAVLTWCGWLPPSVNKPQHGEQKGEQIFNQYTWWEELNFKWRKKKKCATKMVKDVRLKIEECNLRATTAIKLYEGWILVEHRFPDCSHLHFS